VNGQISDRADPTGGPLPSSPPIASESRSSSSSLVRPILLKNAHPSVFLAESIHEMFDEYYSVSLSFWTRTGLREKARQGHLVGSLPWGYIRDTSSGLAVPDPERAPLGHELFERYAGG
jgi:hypothetical protein